MQSSSKQKTSLERSHSAYSNFKLSFVIFLAAISFASLFATLGLKQHFESTFFYLLLFAIGLILLFSFLLIRRFRR